ncbi:hypothetical protein [Sporomusa sphaeroides]|uniref:Uncharacterized protein n=1 Tax=Sporomusa sphaeroides DSM 2875 TaxID=1337886 RepID=A0ABP2CB34_9FIRM|nr:hypothetical protein [Sporomusa sphaeroides]OLS55686.1 hypothetical protein SPSPH_30150 [Sporomusa sphaeroides DSM 2875]CVK19388.1 hypothetical protein SSPH_02039 [Sporomusa sphaeroides DSM 2875]
MEYDVLVKGLNPCVEEEVIIEADGIVLTCFAPWGFPAIEVGKKYKANIGVTILDNLGMKETADSSNSFKQIGSTFAYCIRGKFDLDSRILDAGIQIRFDEDEVDLHDYGYLDGRYVEIKVDRIDIEFE